MRRGFEASHEVDPPYPRPSSSNLSKTIPKEDMPSKEAEKKLNGSKNMSSANASDYFDPSFVSSLFAIPRSNSQPVSFSTPAMDFTASSVTSNSSAASMDLPGVLFSTSFASHEVKDASTKPNSRLRPRRVLRKPNSNIGSSSVNSGAVNKESFPTVPIPNFTIPTVNFSIPTVNSMSDSSSNSDFSTPSGSNLNAHDSSKSSFYFSSNKSKDSSVGMDSDSASVFRFRAGVGQVTRNPLRGNVSNNLYSQSYAKDKSVRKDDDDDDDDGDVGITNKRNEPVTVFTSQQEPLQSTVNDFNSTSNASQVSDNEADYTQEHVSTTSEDSKLPTVSSTSVVSPEESNSLETLRRTYDSPDSPDSPEPSNGPSEELFFTPEQQKTNADEDVEVNKSSERMKMLHLFDRDDFRAKKKTEIPHVVLTNDFIENFSEVHISPKKGSENADDLSLRMGEISIPKSSENQKDENVNKMKDKNSIKHSLNNLKTVENQSNKGKESAFVPFDEMKKRSTDKQTTGKQTTFNSSMFSETNQNDKSKVADEIKIPHFFPPQFSTKVEGKSSEQTDSQRTSEGINTSNFTLFPTFSSHSTANSSSTGFIFSAGKITARNNTAEVTINSKKNSKQSSRPSRNSSGFILKNEGKEEKTTPLPSLFGNNNPSMSTKVGSSEGNSNLNMNFTKESHQVKSPIVFNANSSASTPSTPSTPTTHRRIRHATRRNTKTNSSSIPTSPSMFPSSASFNSSSSIPSSSQFTASVPFSSFQSFENAPSSSRKPTATFTTNNLTPPSTECTPMDISPEPSENSASYESVSKSKRNTEDSTKHHLNFDETEKKNASVSTLNKEGSLSPPSWNNGFAEKDSNNTESFVDVIAETVDQIQEAGLNAHSLKNVNSPAGMSMLEKFLAQETKKFENLSDLRNTSDFSFSIDRLKNAKGVLKDKQDSPTQPTPANGNLPLDQTYSKPADPVPTPLNPVFKPVKTVPKPTEPVPEPAKTFPKPINPVSKLTSHVPSVHTEATTSQDSILTASVKLPINDLGNGSNATVPNTIHASNLENASSQTTDSISPEESAKICEKFRAKGNKQYNIKNYTEAIDYYTKGIVSANRHAGHALCDKSASLCYSNRAAAKMALQQFRDALQDCKRAVKLDLAFIRVRLRAASCYLIVGEVEKAITYFQECANNSNKKEDYESAVENLAKSKKVLECVNQSMALLQKTPSDHTEGLRLINEALLHSPLFEKALEIKARFLLQARKFTEAIKLCESSLPKAQTGLLSKSSGGRDASSFPPLQIWRWKIIGRAYFGDGKLEEALSVLVKAAEEKMPKQQDSNSTVFKEKIELNDLISGIRELLKHKENGNKAFNEGKHNDAISFYSSALTLNVIGESRAFNAVCFCNRAAAYQAIHSYTDAIADCNRAIALNPSYIKALSRRATLNEIIRDYSQAKWDLEHLIQIQESVQMQELGWNSRPASQSTSRLLERQASTVKDSDIRENKNRLKKVNECIQKDVPVDPYLLLGFKTTDSVDECKKLYRKAALKHHPDKANQFLPDLDGSLWKDVGEEVRKKSDHLFKLIGNANTILSNPVERKNYDEAEQVRKGVSYGNNSAFWNNPSSSSSFNNNNNSNWRNDDYNFKTYFNDRFPSSSSSSRKPYASSQSQYQPPPKNYNPWENPYQPNYRTDRPGRGFG